MICKHCGCTLRIKNNIWYQEFDKDVKKKFESWGGEAYSALSRICVRSVSNQPEFGDHEPTKESVVKRILDKI